MCTSPYYAVSSWRRKRWEKVDAEKGQHRFYTAEITQDLWGQWIITRAWGRIGHRPSRTVKEVAVDFNHASSILLAVNKIRLQHGYHEC